MEDIKNSAASCWQRQPPLKMTFTSVLQMKSSSTCLIPASLCEGPIFYFYVESTYSPLSQASIWVVMFHSSICWFVQSCFLSSFVLYDAFIWKNISLKAIYDYKEFVSLSMWFLLYWFCYKRLRSKISTVCSLFSDQEHRFAITNHDLPCASLLWFPLPIASLVIWRKVAVYYDLWLGKCDASCPYFVYRHFTP
jgi:hypothetical protein